MMLHRYLVRCRTAVVLIDLHCTSLMKVTCSLMSTCACFYFSVSSSTPLVSATEPKESPPLSRRVIVQDRVRTLKPLPSPLSSSSHGLIPTSIRIFIFLNLKDMSKNMLHTHLFKAFQRPQTYIMFTWQNANFVRCKDLLGGMMHRFE